MSNIPITATLAERREATGPYGTAVAGTKAAGPEQPEWNGIEKAVFRVAFLYFVLQAVPLDWKFYRDLFSVNWAAVSYGDIFHLTRYQPRFFGEEDTFANWAVLLGIAVVGAFLWGSRDRNRKNYDTAWYGLRVILRYRLAVALLGYGFLKLFPVLAPEPSISNLNTNYGDFTDWKIFSMSLGIVPSYESFLGLVEIIGALLLLNRKTASIGAFLILSFLGNVFMSNLAYEGGEYVYSFYLITMALVLLAFDALRIYHLLTLERPTAPNRFRPVFQGRLKPLRPALKAAFVLFFVGFYGYKVYAGYREGTYQFPQKPGLADAAGLYNVSEFRINGQTLPYSLTDPVRWQDVVFEKWATISIRSNRPVTLDRTNVEVIHRNDADRNYEYAGSAGRQYYAYDIDPQQSVLTLENRNRNQPAERLTLRFSRPNPNTIILEGTDDRRNTIYAVLQKTDKKYLLDEARKTGRRNGLKL
ncbi:DoxX family protein [Larkinella soli]|uniref:DoxX family protein n=1 Tax=Larkinella soli TaxID=1770527 RepID=UPI001E602424|nr:DoxX family protein [Larkinella soli]